jgi:hypothetical protein
LTFSKLLLIFSPTKATYIYHFGDGWNGYPIPSESSSSNNEQFDCYVDEKLQEEEERRRIAVEKRFSAHVRLVDYDSSTDDEGDDD